MDKIILTTIDGREFKCPRPNGRTWILLTEKQEEQEKKEKNNQSDVRYYAEIISICFRNDEITPDFILDNLELSDILPIAMECQMQIMSALNEKLGSIPNAETTVKSTT